jgi:hypothetical protein
VDPVFPTTNLFKNSTSGLFLLFSQIQTPNKSHNNASFPLSPGFCLSRKEKATFAIHEGVVLGFFLLSFFASNGNADAALLCRALCFTQNSDFDKHAVLPIPGKLLNAMMTRRILCLEYNNVLLRLTAFRGWPEVARLVSVQASRSFCYT